MIIEDFPLDDKYWRVDWVGELVENPLIPSEPKVAVYLSLLKDDYKNPLHNASLARKTTRITVAQGQIHLINTSSVWRNQEETFGLDRINVYDIKIDTTATESATFSSALLNTKLFFIPETHYPVFENEADLSHCPIIYAMDLNQKNKNRCITVFPTNVILNYYCLKSTNLCHAIINNDLAYLIDKSKSKILPNRDLSLSLNSTTYVDEIQYIARWFAEERMRQEIENMNRNFRANRVNARSNESFKSQFYFNFPFYGTSHIKIRGKYLKVGKLSNGEEVWTLLVTQILKCSHKFDYANIIYDGGFDNSKGVSVKDSKVQYKVKGNRNKKEPKKPRLGSKNESNNSDRTRIEHPNQQSQPDFKNHLLTRRLKTEQETESKTILKNAHADNSGSYGTSPDTYSKEGAKKADINLSESQLNSRMNLFLSMITSLRELGVEIRTVAPPKNRAYFGLELSARFPHKIAGLRSWHLQRGNMSQPRHIIFAKVTAKSGYCYLVELEPKNTATSTILLWKDDNTELKVKEIEALILDLAIKQSWVKLFKSNKNMNYVSIVHPSVKAKNEKENNDKSKEIECCPDAYALRIYDKMVKTNHLTKRLDEEQKIKNSSSKPNTKENKNIEVA